MKDKLTPKEQERHDTILSCSAGKITNTEAAAKLRLTVRQVRRLKRKVEKLGESGIRHGNRDRTSNRATDAKTKAEVVAFMQEEKHRDFGPTFAQEQLVKQKHITLSTETIRTILSGEKLWKPKVRRTVGIHREWRERMALYGELAQFDGSYHDWFENGTEACLLAAIDDATGRIHAVFEDNEGVRAVFRFWWTYLERYGLPAALYLDKFSTYKINHKNAEDNAGLMTQFGRAMETLGIRVICANSPQAKGRVERSFGTLQDRLVKEMRLAGIRDRASANVFLADVYLPEHSVRFGVSARKEGDAHRPLTDELRAQLPSIFSLQSTRHVNNDYTIQFKNQWFQLKATTGVTVYKGDTVTIEERLDDTTHIKLRAAYLEYEKLPEQPKRSRAKVTALVKKSAAHKPAADHPWRKDAARAAGLKKTTP